MLLEVVNLSTEFETLDSTFCAIDGISFQLKGGETLGIVGESGSGKSALALSLLQLHSRATTYTKGQAIYYGSKEKVDLLNLSAKRIQQYRGSEIAMIFQEPNTSLNPVLRCGHQIDEVLIRHKKYSSKAARIETLNLLKKMQLADPERIYRSYPHQISGGQKQRVMIAMAMSGEPKLLIADEPTTALDVTVQKSILELMRQLKEETGMAMLFISHDLELVHKMADQVLVVKDGKIAESGTADQIFHHSTHPYSQSLLASRPSRLRPRKSELISTTAAGKMNSSGLDFFSVHGLSLNYHSISNEPKAGETFVGIRDINFTLALSETLGIVGESGSGKTTLAKLMVGLLQANSGSITLKGSELRGRSAKQLLDWRKDVQLIFQDPYASLNPARTIEQALSEPMRIHNIAKSSVDLKKRVVNLLEQVGLSSDVLYKFPREFSGGERQRICIARALAVEPKVLICDEAVSSLDVNIQAQILKLLRDIQSSTGLSLIFISHDLGVIRYMSDKVLVMHNGTKVEHGLTEAIFSNPESIYTKTLMQSSTSEGW